MSSQLCNLEILGCLTQQHEGKTQRALTYIAEVHSRSTQHCTGLRLPWTAGHEVLTRAEIDMG